MPLGESAGSVYVTIDGDASPLIAKYAQAEAQSRAAGQRIASGLGQGLSSASGIVDQFGRAVSSGIAAPTRAAEAPVDELTAAINSLTAAMARSTPATTQAGNAFRGMGTAAHASVTEIQATSGALRTLEGNGGIRAAERFIVTSLGLGPAMQAIFPIVGALALSEILIKIGESVIKAADNFLYLRDAEEEVVRVSKEMESGVESAIDHIRQLQVEALREQGKLVAAAQLEQANAAQKFIKIPQPDDKKIAGLSDDDLAKLKADLANVLPADLSDRIHQIKQDLGDAATLWQETRKHAFPIDPFSTHIENQAAAAMQLYGNALQFLQAKSDEFTESQKAAGLKIGVAAHQESTKELETQKQFLEMQRQSFKDHYDGKLEDLKAAHQVSHAEELRFRQQELADPRLSALGGADGNPVARQVRNQIGTLSQDVDRDQVADEKKKADALKAIRAAELRDFAEDGRLMDEQLRANEASARAEAEARTREGSLAQRTGQLQVERTGIGLESANEIDKLKARQQYELQSVHTKAQQVAYAEQMADFDEKSLQLKISIAQMEFIQAVQEQNRIPTREGLLKIEEDSLKIEQAKAALKKQQAEDAIKIQGAQNQDNLGIQLGNDAKQGASSLSGALATGIMNGGKGIGKDIEGALKGIGQKMLGDVFAKLLEQLGVNAAIDAITNSLGLTHITAQAANTAAVIANTAAVTASAGVGAAGSAVGAAGGIAASGASAASGGLTAMIGGIIGGAISAVASLVGDAAIVKAVNQTTQAVLSLRGNLIAQPNGTTTSHTGTSQPQAATVPTSMGTEILASVFGAITGSGAMRVNVVAISPLAPLAGFLSIFGFAGGGRPTPGVPYIVGEKGPELRIDDAPGIIIPNTPSMAMVNGFQNSSGYSTSSHSQSLSIGQLHVHGMQSAESFARALPRVLKTRAPNFSPATT